MIVLPLFAARTEKVQRFFVRKQSVTGLRKRNNQTLLVEKRRYELIYLPRNDLNFHRMKQSGLLLCASVVLFGYFNSSHDLGAQPAESPNLWELARQGKMSHQFSTLFT